MDNTKSGNKRTPSTTWEWRRVKTSRGAAGQTSTARAAHRWFGRSSRDPREPLTIKISYRGGPEAWYEIHARGSVGRFPGHVCIHDAMQEINQAKS